MASSLSTRAPFAAVRQVYRCPNDHLSEVVWNVDSVCSAVDGAGLRVRCPKCTHSALATDAQAKSLLEALGLWTPRVDA